MTTENHNPDTDLRDALAGDGRAFGRLVAPHLALMYRVAARLAGSESTAEDAVQEALQLAWERLPSLKSRDHLRAFLLGMAAGRARTLRRSEWRKGRKVLVGGAEAPEQPAELAVADQLAEGLQRALATLPEKRRAAVVMRLDGGLSYQEIARALATSTVSARVLVHLGTRQLSGFLSKAGLVEMPVEVLR
jgi:RNA polymerase sigma-70 factor (ECF subfamily)